MPDRGRIVGKDGISLRRPVAISILGIISCDRTEGKAPVGRKARFVSNVDATDFAEATRDLDPEEIVRGYEIKRDKYVVVTDDELERPRNSPLAASSSHRALHVRQAHESSRSDARYNRSTSNDPQYGHWKCPPSSPTRV